MVVTNKQLVMMINNAVLDGSYYKSVDWDGMVSGWAEQPMLLISILDGDSTS